MQTLPLINTVGVVGAGQMGLGITQVMLMAGYQVLLHDVDPNSIELARARLSNALARAQAKRPELNVEQLLSRLIISDQLAVMKAADLVIEAVAEQAYIKTQLFAQLDKLCSEQTIFASNTSSLSIGRLAAAISRPERVIGMHFMNPVPVIRLVEVIRSEQTDQQTVEAVEQCILRLGKSAVHCRDFPGFIVNRLLIPMLNEAICALDQQVASAEQIDLAMQLGCAHSMGPLALADLIGLDTCLSIMQVLHSGFDDAKYLPSPRLVEMVKQGKLGRKTGQGFYEY